MRTREEYALNTDRHFDTIEATDPLEIALKENNILLGVLSGILLDIRDILLDAVLENLKKNSEESEFHIPREIM